MEKHGPQLPGIKSVIWLKFLFIFLFIFCRYWSAFRYFSQPKISSSCKNTFIYKIVHDVHSVWHGYVNIEWHDTYVNNSSQGVKVYSAKEDVQHLRKSNVVVIDVNNTNLFNNSINYLSSICWCQHRSTSNCWIRAIVSVLFDQCADIFDKSNRIAYQIRYILLVCW